MPLKDTISRALDVDIMQLDIVNHADVTVDLKELYLDIKIYENIRHGYFLTEHS